MSLSWEVVKKISGRLRLLAPDRPAQTRLKHMPLNWDEVKKKYGAGAKVPTIVGDKFVTISNVTDQAIHIWTPIWTAELARADLEKGVALIEDGTISRDPGLFVEDYMLYVTRNRATSTAHILRDLGFLDATETFTIRC
jgi:hypothetical protein